MAHISVSYEVHMRDEFGRFLAEYEAGMVRAVGESLLALQSAARANAPKRRGQLAGSITAAQTGKSGVVFTTVPHGAPQEHGARPHFIPGGLGHNPGVDHPGNPATHFMRRAADAVKHLFVRNVEKHFPA